MSWETLAPKRTEAGDEAANGPDIDEADREFLELMVEPRCAPSCWCLGLPTYICCAWLDACSFAIS